MRTAKLVALVLALALALPGVFAFFTPQHEIFTIRGFDQVDSAITQQCAPYLQQVIDGNVGADVPVLHYFENTEGAKFMSYISTHTKGSGWEACKEVAGADTELRCMCVGVVLHEIQDSFAHNEGGLVPTYLDKYFSSNLIGHMTVEKDFEIKHVKYLKEQGDSVAKTNGKLDSYDRTVCASFFEDTGGDIKYVDLFNHMTGIDIRNDLNLFCNGYKGEGFYDTVYNEKLKLPWWFWGLSIGMMVIGILIAGATAYLGNSNWKWALVAWYLIIASIGAGILISFETGNTWRVVENAVRIPSYLGVLSVSQADVIKFDKLAQDATNKFLETGYVPVDDASGLSYRDSRGQWHEGALGQAEKSFKYVLFPILAVIYAVMNIVLFRLSFRRR